MEEAAQAVHGGHKLIYKSLGKQKIGHPILSGDPQNLDKKSSIASYNYFCPSVDCGFDDPAKSSVHVEVYLARQKKGFEIDKILDELAE